MKNHQLSLGMAILINLNIMMGVGIFINTVELAKRAGMLGGLNYLFVGILMLPLITSVATLVRMYPAGGFYTYAQQEIGSFAGFIGAWAYFIAKLASSSVMIHTSVLFLQALFPALQSFSPFFLDGLILCLFISLNMLNIKTSSIIQALFMSFKTMPLVCAIVGGLFLTFGNHAVEWDYIWAGIPSSLPLVLYAVMGFEIACSISSKIENAEKNAPKAIFISYGIVLCITVLYQTLFYGALGTILASYVDYRQAFPGLLAGLLPAHANIAGILVSFLHLGIATSALGGAYGILFSNSWNLHILAHNNHVPGARWLTQLNKHQIPFVCVIVEGIICALYLTVTRGSQAPLQQLSGLGTVMAYTMSVLALIRAKRRNPALTIHKWIPWLGLGSCIILISACIRNFVIGGIIPLCAFLLLLTFGIGLYSWSKRQQSA